ncbi:MAG: M12 family metallo-peptidase [Phycisphaerales bacterium]|nr:M12 family metallo-peptidase [Phycisphaerales bacterium]
MSTAWPAVWGLSIVMGVPMATGGDQAALELDGPMDTITGVVLPDGRRVAPGEPVHLALTSGRASVPCADGVTLRLHRHGGVVAGDVRGHGGRPLSFTMQPDGMTRWHVGPAMLPCATCADGSRVHHGPQATGRFDGPPPRAGGDDGSVQDVLVLYTPAAREAAGSSEAMRANALLWEDGVNAALQGSGGTTSVRMVGIEEASANAQGNISTDLSRMMSTSDGWWDEAHTTRDALGADMVVLIVATTDADGDGQDDACGIANVITHIPGVPSAAFAVVLDQCAGANYSLAHELGHLQGCAHDAENAGVSGIDARAYGWPFWGAGDPCTDDRWCTIMAYPGYDQIDNCPGSGQQTTIWTQRIGLFSTPDVTWHGTPVGDSAVADNTAIWNERAVVTAGYRSSVIPLACPGDLDASGSVTVRDLVHVLTQWGLQSGRAGSDINGDGDVDFYDLLVVLSLFGEC